MDLKTIAEQTITKITKTVTSKMSRIYRRRVISRRPNSERMLNDNLQHTISLPFAIDSDFKRIQNQNVFLDVMTIKSSDIFALSYRQGSVMKYNKFHVRGIRIMSSSTASYITTGTHAAAVLFDEQLLTPGLTGDAGIAAGLKVMQNMGNSQIKGPAQNLNVRAGLPMRFGFREFQDVQSPAATADTFDPTRVCKIMLVYPSNAPPNCFIHIDLTFSGKGPIISAAPATYAAFETKYIGSEIPNLVEFFNLALEKLGLLTPYQDYLNNPVVWKKTLAVAIKNSNSTSRFSAVGELDALPLGEFWFPKQEGTGQIVSSLRQLCDIKIDDERLCGGEHYYAPTTYYVDVVPSLNRVGSPFVREVAGLISVHKRTADEILSSAVEPGMGALRITMNEEDSSK